MHLPKHGSGGILSSMSNTTKTGLKTLMKMSEAEARSFLEAQRWPNGATCPHCAVVGEATRIESAEGSKTRDGVWQCNACREQFTVTVGTVMEGSHLPLSTWLAAIHMICSSKKSVSAAQVQRQLEIGSYRTAWHLCHRIRFMLANGDDPTKLVGDVEADEMYVGGKPRHAAGTRKSRSAGSKAWREKRVPVAVLVSRDGKARARAMEKVTSDNLRSFLTTNADASKARLMTDELALYRPIGRKFAGGHEVVRHNLREYARKDGVHSNTAESFNGLFKRSIQGSWHHISREHIGRYLDEQCFRWSNKSVSDFDRTKTALAQMNGVRLYYKQPRRQGQQDGARLVAGA